MFHFREHLKSGQIGPTCGMSAGSKWGDEEEFVLGKEIEQLLPDNKRKLARNDRGIYGDAIQNECGVIIHENPKDFRKLDQDARDRDIVLIDLYNKDCTAAIQILEKAAA